MRKRTLKLLLLLLSCLLMLSACGNEPEQPETTPPTTQMPTEPKLYSVTFMVDGELMTTTYAREGQLPDMAWIPNKTGYEFAGWLLNGEPWDGNQPLTQDLTVEASWTKERIWRYAASFMIDGQVHCVVDVYYDEEAALPEAPQMEGRQFAGWYFKGARIEQYPDVDYGSVEIEARWVYHIDSAEELLNMQPEGQYILTKDIDLGGARWKAVGDVSAPFTGILDGGGHTVSNFTLVAERYDSHIGFIGYNTGTVKDLHLGNYKLECSSTQRIYLGTVVGCNQGTVSGCSAAGKLAIETEDPVHVGGIVGWNNGGSITDCVFQGKLTVKDSDEFAYVGGIAGENSNGGTVSGCKATGSVSAKGDGRAYAGGIVGSSDGTVECCAAELDSVTADGHGYAFAGGVAGGGGKIVNCYATADISASTGLSGWSFDAYAGGVSGAGGQITNCYATGTVSGEGHQYAYVGGIVGLTTEKVENCFATGNVKASSPHGYAGKETAYAGHVVGREADADVANCHYMSGQKVTIDATQSHYCDLGRKTAKENLTSGEWVKNNIFLEGRDAWKFLEGDYPMLKT